MWIPRRRFHDRYSKTVVETEPKTRNNSRSPKTVVEVKYSPFLFRHSAQLEKLCFSHIDTPALSEQISYQIAPTTVPYAAVRPHPPPVLVDHHSCKS
ncbi:hypothetical protein TIFTF001_050658 [Ficus carica]|uniref:Uncharacterized protein n=1 Tax=Ficus carica TaxID=3494 RepID=A0AA87ZP75_FICCA|nr:hypothetical protein TIFTF001_050658 [Ficus carica]